MDNEKINQIKTTTRKIISSGIKIYELSNPNLEHSVLHAYDYMEYKVAPMPFTGKDSSSLKTKRDFSISHSSLNSEQHLLPLIVAYSNFLCLLLHNKRIFSYKLLPRHENDQLFNIDLIPTDEFEIVGHSIEQHQYLFIISEVVKLIFTASLDDLQKVVNNTNVYFCNQTSDQSMFVDEVDMSLMDKLMESHKLPPISSVAKFIVLNRINP